MSKFMNFISLNKRYIYTNVIMIYVLYIILKSNWSYKFDKTNCVHNNKVKSVDNLHNDFIDLENYQTDITKQSIEKDETHFYRVNFDRQLELVVKFILVCFILMIVVLANST